MIVSLVMTVHTLRKKGKIKTVPFISRLPSYRVFQRTVNWLNSCGRENIFGEDCWDGYAEKCEGAKLLRFRERECYWGL